MRVPARTACHRTDELMWLCRCASCHVRTAVARGEGRTSVVRVSSRVSSSGCCVLLPLPSSACACCSVSVSADASSSSCCRFAASALEPGCASTMRDSSPPVRRPDPLASAGENAGCFPLACSSSSFLLYTTHATRQNPSVFRINTEPETLIRTPPFTSETRDSLEAHPHAPGGR